MQEVEMVFSVPGRYGVVDFALPREDGVLVSSCERETLEQIQLRYPGAVLMTYDEAVAAHAEFMKVAPSEIDKERFFDMLEVLPPVNWVRHDNSESFKMLERSSGDITGIFVRIGSRYFSMEDSTHLPHGIIVEMVYNAFPDLKS